MGTLNGRSLPDTAEGDDFRLGENIVATHLFAIVGIRS
jgi:hypothetical protein